MSDRTEEKRLPVAVALCFIATLSGCAALLFETLWFRVAGLTFGNGLWASSIVLAAFMAGLALGNIFSARWADRLARPIRTYAALEVGIAVTGLTFVVGMPFLADALRPLFQALHEMPLLVNGVRLTTAFVWMMLPATLMGATLPVMVKALGHSDSRFGRVLGQLYGWNTLGAVVGAMIGEVWLLEWLGVRGSAGMAAAINLTAALGAMVLSARTESAHASEPSTQSHGPASPQTRRWLFAAFLSGAIFLALEVVWFRFLSLFVYGTSLAFAALLAVVLVSIGAGGLVASRWLREDRPAAPHVANLALASAALVLACYCAYPLVLSSLLAPGSGAATAVDVGMIAIPLILPIGLISGVMFTALGDATRREVGADGRTTGLLTFWNTVGAALGSLAGGFLLLPYLGMERSFLLLSLAYVLLAGVVLTRAHSREVWLRRGVLAALWLGLVLAFPSGLMRDTFLTYSMAPFDERGSRIVAIREGPLQTIVLLETQRFGRPLHHRLLTDGFSMSGTAANGRRYMKAYVYLPVAIHAGLRSALLISYGTGSTAKALSDTRDLEVIDIVDISADILATSSLIFSDPDDDPLRDPRVDVHIEDGRFFLQTTDRMWDLITSEPPPPKHSGVVNLYSREYFEEIRGHLTPGGMTTYWLPVHSLGESDARSIIRAFCDVFDDCTLWTGSGLDWMLVGSRGQPGPVTAEHFARQWGDPAILPELTALGFEHPAQLGTTFMAGSQLLRALTKDDPPVVDDFPHRISAAPVWTGEAAKPALYRQLMDVNRTSKAFRDSPFVARSWPADVRADTLKAFRWQRLLNLHLAEGSRGIGLRQLHEILTESDLEALPLWLLGTHVRERAIAQELEGKAAESAQAQRVFAAAAFARRDWTQAAEHLERVRQTEPDPFLIGFEAYARCITGDTEAARSLSQRLLKDAPAMARNEDLWIFLAETCGLPDPRAN